MCFVFSDLNPATHNDSDWDFIEISGRGERWFALAVLELTIAFGLHTALGFSMASGKLLFPECDRTG